MVSRSPRKRRRQAQESRKRTPNPTTFGSGTAVNTRGGVLPVPLLDTPKTMKGSAGVVNEVELSGEVIEHPCSGRGIARRGILNRDALFW